MEWRSGYVPFFVVLANTNISQTNKWNTNKYDHSGSAGISSNGKEGVLHTPLVSKAADWPSESLVSDLMECLTPLEMIQSAYFKSRQQGVV